LRLLCITVYVFYLFFLIAAHLYQFEILDLLPNLFTKEKGTHQSSR
jgi:hypothetical protein